MLWLLLFFGRWNWNQQQNNNRQVVQVTIMRWMICRCGTSNGRSLNYQKIPFKTKRSSPLFVGAYVIQVLLGFGAPNTIQNYLSALFLCLTTVCLLTMIPAGAVRLIQVQRPFTYSFSNAGRFLNMLTTGRAYTITVIRFWNLSHNICSSRALPFRTPGDSSTL